MIIWITGLSGSGKTTIASCLMKKYKKKLPELINIDGDLVRQLYGNKLGFNEKSRIIQIKRIQKLCFFLEKQKLHIIASALYNNLSLLKWNRKNFSDYFEIYINAPLSLVKKRDTKNIYKKFSAGKVKNVVGLDIPWEGPINPDLEIKMKEETSVDEVIKLIEKKIKIFKSN